MPAWKPSFLKSTVSGLSINPTDCCDRTKKPHCCISYNCVKTMALTGTIADVALSSARALRPFRTGTHFAHIFSSPRDQTKQTKKLAHIDITNMSDRVSRNEQITVHASRRTHLETSEEIGQISDGIQTVLSEHVPSGLERAGDFEKNRYEIC
jgi:hypothetical protein